MYAFRHFSENGAKYVVWPPDFISLKTIGICVCAFPFNFQESPGYLKDS